MDLEARLHSAIKTLESLLTQNDEMYRRRDTERLRGKIEGIKLALSYLNDEKTERIREREELLDNHERISSIAYDFDDFEGQDE